MSEDTHVIACPAAELGPGERRVISTDEHDVLVLNCGGELFAVENCCTHEDAPLDDGEIDESQCTIECSRHGSRFDLRTGEALNLPAYMPVETFDVEVVDGMVSVAVD